MPNKNDLLWLRKKLQEGPIRVVLDRNYPPAEAQKAHEYLEKAMPGAKSSCRYSIS